MSEKVSKLPIIAVIATASVALIALSSMQANHTKAAQEDDRAMLNQEHAETAAVMKRIGEEAAQQQAPSIGFTQSVELKKLEDEDRRWLAEHPLSPTPPRPATH